VDSKADNARQKLAELDRAQEELERKHAALEGARRPQPESQPPQQEMIEHLERELGLLEETELEARQEAGQMARSISEFRDALRRQATVEAPLNNSSCCHTFPQVQGTARMNASVSKRSFREAVCQHFRCAPEAYERTVFRRCLYRHAVWPALLLHQFSPDYFRLDFELIRVVASMTDTEQVWAEVRLHRAEHPPVGFLRRNLRLRVSFQRLLDLSTHLFAEQPAAAPAGTRNLVG
jgi:hypothetical protein